jgi:parvulin-like peptidyl-prolyl isomerase
VLLAALNTPTGGISEPVKAGGGFFVVKTLERRAADPEGFAKVRDQVGKQLLDAKRSQAWDRWVKSLFVGSKVQVQGETVPER